MVFLSKNKWLSKNISWYIIYEPQKNSRFKSKIKWGKKKEKVAAIQSWQNSGWDSLEWNRIHVGISVVKYLL
jgi:hypothetical protein